MDNKDVNEVKRNYKKLRNIFLIILILVILIFLGKFIYDIVILNNIFEHNLDVKMGDNYKVITKEGDNVIERYFKGDRAKLVAGNGSNEMFWYKDNVYMMDNDKKEYIDYSEEEVMPSRINANGNYVSFMPSIYLSREDVDTLFEIIKYKYIFGLSVSSEQIDGKDFYVIKSDMDIKLWYSKEDYKFEKELNYGRITTIEVIENVVTDEDMLLPIERGYTKIEINN